MRILFCILLLFASKGYAADGVAISQARLENGLQIIVIPDHRAPVVTHMVWYRVGAADEPSAQSGIAHYLEHLMFKGTENIENGEFSNIISSLGGQQNAFTSQDYTAYFQHIAKQYLPKVMEMEADRMQGLVLSEDIVQAERGVVLEERASSMESNPSSMWRAKVSKKLFGDHPYGTPIIGHRSEIEGLSVPQVLRFYKKYYAPNHALLLVAGDARMEEVLPLARKYYGGLVASEVARPVRPVVKPIAKNLPPVIFRSPYVRHSGFQMRFLTPSWSEGKRGKDVAALEVLTQILGGGAISRLYERLVVKEKLASSVSASIGSVSFSGGQLVIFASPISADGAEIPQIERVIAEEIGLLQKKGVSGEELEVAIEELVAEEIYSRDSQTALAHIYGQAWASETPVELIREWAERIRGVRARHVRKVARKWLGKNALTAYLLPENAAEGL